MKLLQFKDKRNTQRQESIKDRSIKEKSLKAVSYPHIQRSN